MITVLIIEDEELAAEKLEILLHKSNMDIEILAKIDSVEGSLEWLAKHQDPDLIFMDIHLSDGSSFSILERAQSNAPVIFTTAFDHYAVKAFKHNGVDYLLKPFGLEDINLALEKYKERNYAPSELVNLKSLLQDLKGEQQHMQKRFLVHKGPKIITIGVEEVAFFYAADKMVYLKDFKNNDHVIDFTLDKLECLLDQECFFRINRKIIVNVQAIQELYYYSKSKLKVILSPESNFDVFVPIEKTAKLKKWLNQ